MSAEFDLYARENAAIAAAERTIAQPVDDPAVARDALADLVKEYQRLFSQVRRLVRMSDRNETDLRTANQRIEEQKTELSTALEALRQAQGELVQAGKLAALGQLVAGIAHEINTPLGIAVTTASTLDRDRGALADRMAEGAMKKSDLTAYLTRAEEGHRILASNLDRAAGLVRSFKQVAVDQSADDRRRFDLRAFLDDVVLSLSPNVKRAGATVEVTCPAGIGVDGWPGALSQVVTNLVMNALIHALGDRKGGIVSISAELDGGTVVLTVADDGAGMPEDVRARIFDPFFTTRRGSGGSGLGLSIVYNIVTGRLGGTVTVDSTEGTGTTFTVRFPATAAEDAKP